MRKVLDVKKVRRAEHVIAFCGRTMHVLKSRSRLPDKLDNFPMPELVIGYFPRPKPHTEVIEFIPCLKKEK